jgi:hypothetical protein
VGREGRPSGTAAGAVTVLVKLSICGDVGDCGAKKVAPKTVIAAFILLQQ